jgi:hypothetical protein
MAKNEEMGRLALELTGRAFLDIRVFSAEGNSRACHSLADLFHTVPLQLCRIRDEDGDFQEVMNWLNMRAEQKKMTQWLQNALDDIAQ